MLLLPCRVIRCLGSLCKTPKNITLFFSFARVSIDSISIHRARARVRASLVFPQSIEKLPYFFQYTLNIIERK